MRNLTHSLVLSATVFAVGCGGSPEPTAIDQAETVQAMEAAVDSFHIIGYKFFETTDAMQMWNGPSLPEDVFELHGCQVRYLHGTPSYYELTGYIVLDPAHVQRLTVAVNQSAFKLGWPLAQQAANRLNACLPD